MTDRFSTHHRGILAELTRLTSAREPFTLCVVVRCTGSTYRKAGALAVVKADGARRGVISGGCLEADLEAAARAALTEERARLVRFDTRSDDDLVFGSGSGCRGQIEVLMLPVAAHQSHPFCTALLAADRAHETLTATFLTNGPGLGEVVLGPPADATPGTYAVVSFPPAPRILLIGAGPEAPALNAIAGQLGWRVTVSDHRAALLERHATGAERTHCARPAATLAAFAGERFDACIVMTHSAANDREALAALAQRSEPFVGLLGPPVRRDELLAELDPQDRDALAPRLHAPVGIRLGGHGPEMLALSICAELQRFLAGRNDSHA
jgi:xanthine/CO dehydrogenase XdhC/CoxF family maturation factor